jgi:uncharacterized protein
MKLHLNTPDSLNSISGHGRGFVMINDTRQTTRLETAAIIMPDRLVSPWRVADPSAVNLADFTAVLELKPELVIFGSGTTFRFPDPRIMAAFSQAKIGFDVMDTPAACRTYNVLMSEGRNVAAALLIPAAA